MRSEGITLVLSTHDMEDAAALADRIYVLQAGRVALHGTPGQVFFDGTRLQEAGLRPPLAVRLFQELRALGLETDQSPVTEEEVLEFARERVGQR
jgi:cobalt/nickel transport system ATP-binding protein